MIIREVDRNEFISLYGDEGVDNTPSLVFFTTDKGVGVIKDTRNGELDIRENGELNINTFTMENELALLTIVAGDYREPVESVSLRTHDSYAEEYTESKRSINVLYISAFLFLVLSTVIWNYFYR